MDGRGEGEGGLKRRVGLLLPPVFNPALLLLSLPPVLQSKGAAKTPPFLQEFSTSVLTFNPRMGFSKEGQSIVVNMNV